MFNTFCAHYSLLTTDYLLRLLIQDDPFMFNTFCTVTEPDEVPSKYK